MNFCTGCRWGMGGLVTLGEEGDVCLCVMPMAQGQADWSWRGCTYCERFLRTASHGCKDTWTTLCPFEDLAGSDLCPVCLWAGGVVLCGAAMRSTLCPPSCVQVCALCGALLCLCNAWQVASSDSERRCHWLHISAGYLGQCWKRFSDASIPEASAACVAVGVCPSSQHGHQRGLFKLCLSL